MHCFHAMSETLTNTYQTSHSPQSLDSAGTPLTMLGAAKAMAI